MFTETLNDIMAKRLLSREKLSEITGANVTLIDEWLNGTKEPDERQIQKLSEKLNISISSLTPTSQPLVRGQKCNLILAIVSVIAIILSIFSFFYSSVSTIWIFFLFFISVIALKVYFRKYKLSDLLLLPLLLQAVSLSFFFITH